LAQKNKPKKPKKYQKNGLQNKQQKPSQKNLIFKIKK